MPPHADSGRAVFACDGDGTSGYRYQVLYARPSNAPNAFAAHRQSFGEWAADADSMMRASSGGTRRFRWVTGADCRPDVAQAVVRPLAADAANSFDTVVSQLMAQGYSRTDRKYLIFLDGDSRVACGTDTFWPDDSASQTNQNNSGPSFAVIYSSCWVDVHTVGHELMHTLGGVQWTAPHTSGGGHCVDDHDVMCYSDSPNNPRVTIVCADPIFELRYDCNHDDFFDPLPPHGSYLATHWDAADSRFLVGGSPAPADTAPPTVAWSTPAVASGENWDAPSGSGEIALAVDAAADTGVARVRFERYDDAAGRWVPIATDRAVPFTATLDAEDLNLDGTRGQGAAHHHRPRDLAGRHRGRL